MVQIVLREQGMVTLETIEKWLVEPVETEHLEFKEAKNQFDTNKLMRYCVAIANERGGCLILGVTDKRPRIAVCFMSVIEECPIKLCEKDSK